MSYPHPLPPLPQSLTHVDVLLSAGPIDLPYLESLLASGESGEMGSNGDVILECTAHEDNPSASPFPSAMIIRATVDGLLPDPDDDAESDHLHLTLTGQSN